MLLEEPGELVRRQHARPAARRRSRAAVQQRVVHNDWSKATGQKGLVESDLSNATSQKRLAERNRSTAIGDRPGRARDWHRAISRPRDIARNRAISRAERLDGRCRRCRRRGGGGGDRRSASRTKVFTFDHGQKSRLFDFPPWSRDSTFDHGQTARRTAIRGDSEWASAAGPRGGRRAVPAFDQFCPSI